MKIDVHAHIIPEAFVEGDTVHFPLDGSSEVETRPLRPLQNFEPETMYSVSRRLRDMDEGNVDMHVLSLQPMFTYALPPERALPVSRGINNAFAEIVQQNPGRFLALADLPMHSPEDAARELERAVRDLGLSGAEICSQINGTNLDDAGLRPFYEKMQELDVPVFIHPASVPGLEQRLGRYYLTNLIGNPMDTTIAAASLIFGGVLREFPSLKFYLAHAGGACPYIHGRWDHGWRVRGEGRQFIDRLPSEYLRLLYFDCLAHGGPALKFLVETMGPERVMLGSDYPFDMSDTDPVRTIASLAGVSSAEKELMYSGNARELFKIGA
jgi:aminocarboxymuconate-semialdehyde decarboxylase